jgi:MFS family permease
LVDTIGWRSIFWLNIPIGITAFLLTKFFISESRGEKSRRFDPVGQLLIITFLATLIFGIIEAPQFGWTTLPIIGCFLVSLVSFIGIIWYEGRRFEPLLELKFFRSAPFTGANLVAISAFIALGGFLFLNTLYLQDVRNFSASRAGLFLLPMAGAMFILGPISGYVVGKRGPRIPLIVGAIAISLAALLFVIRSGTISNSELFQGYALIGIGLGVLNAAITNSAVSGMPRSQAGVASAMTSTARQIGQSLGVAIIGSVLASNVQQITAGAAFTNGFRTSWWIIFSSGIIVLIVALITTGKWGKRTAERMSAYIEVEEKN